MHKAWLSLYVGCATLVACTGDDPVAAIGTGDDASADIGTGPVDSSTPDTGSAEDACAPVSCAAGTCGCPSFGPSCTDAGVKASCDAPATGSNAATCTAHTTQELPAETSGVLKEGLYDLADIGRYGTTVCNPQEVPHGALRVGRFGASHVFSFRETYTIRGTTTATEWTVQNPDAASPQVAPICNSAPRKIGGFSYSMLTNGSADTLHIVYDDNTEFTYVRRCD